MTKYNYVTEMPVDTLPTGRTYHTPDGSYPSITTILAKTSNQAWLAAWIARVGEAEAARISKIATDRGTLVHEYAEKHFNGIPIFAELEQEAADVIHLTKELIKITEAGNPEVWGQEQILWSNKYKFAGRCDMVGLWNGVPSIIDFKTSKKVKNIKQIKDYFIQGCSYCVAHNERYGTGIKQIVINMTIDDKPGKTFIKPAPMFLPELKNRIRSYYAINNKRKSREVSEDI